MLSSDDDNASVRSASLADSPSEYDLEEALRNTVVSIFKSGTLDELTVRRVRLSSEKKLGLEVDFFKNHASWKEKSAAIIKEEVQRQDELGTAKETEPPQSPSPEKSKSASKPKTPRENKASKSRKRKQDDQPEKDFEDTTEIQEEQSGSELSEVIDSEREQANSKKPKRAKKAEQAQPQKRRSSTTSATRGSKNNTALDPDQAEIKKLQGWLNSCGVRKMWFRELAPYETPKAKIQHLKDMLREVGMTGRYSIEKARNIRERRELQEDLAAVQEGAQKWGTKENGTSNERRRGTASAQALAFLGEDDGEESD